MNILFVSSEVVPFAKTGGLADVCGSLPIELARLGHNVAVMMPAYRQVKGHPGIESLNIKFDVPIGNKIVRGRLLRSTLPNSEVPIFFIEQDDYFDRPDLYRQKGEDYKDNCERFAFFVGPLSKRSGYSSWKSRSSIATTGKRASSLRTCTSNMPTATATKRSARSSRFTTWRTRESSGTGTC